MGRHFKILIGILFIEHKRRPPHQGSQTCTEESQDATNRNFSKYETDNTDLRCLV